MNQIRKTECCRKTPVFVSGYHRCPTCEALVEFLTCEAVLEATLQPAPQEAPQEATPEHEPKHTEPEETPQEEPQETPAPETKPAPKRPRPEGQDLFNNLIARF